MYETEVPARNRTRQILPLVLIVLAGVIGAFALGDVLTFAALRDNRDALLSLRDAHYATAIALYFIAYVAIVALSLPGATIGTLTGGFLFGLWVGATITVFAATLGAVIIFSAARTGFGRGLAARMDASEGTLKRLKAGLDENQWSMLFLLRLVPVVPFFVANLLPAFVNVPVHRYVVSTFIGIMPGAIVYTSVGAGLGEVFAADQTPNLSIIFEPHVLGPLLGLSALALLPIVLRRVSR